MPKLVMLKGLPASGKSTYAKELVAEGYKRLNKDDLRAMIDNSVWSRKNEVFIEFIERTTANDLLNDKQNVVIDDTNFAWEAKWHDLAIKCGAEFEVKFFDTPVMECIERDSKRGDKSVGAKVIFGMYDKYLKPKQVAYDPSLGNSYIFDIDGTLAKMTGRSPYDYTKVDTDVINPEVVRLNYILGVMHKIILVSGRKEECREQTEKWLQDNAIAYNELHMRKTGDDRNDAIVKKEIYEEHIKGKTNVLAVFDDRNRVVDMWRSLGLTCLQVDYGNF